MNKIQEFMHHLQDGSTAPIRMKGRDAWALRNLIAAGESGCTPIDTPGPRWSGYVHKLRRRYQIDIETIHENHGGPFPGTHARYVLRSNITLADPEMEAA